MKKIVVIGGGQAGFSTIAKLRALEFDGEIILICGEDELPYQRPPLSKKYLLGTFERGRLYLRQEKFYVENDIHLRLGEWCHYIDRDQKIVTVGDEKQPYDILVLATGSIPKQLPASVGGTLKGVHTIRNLADIDKINSDLDRSSNAVVVGGGYIGLEVAASLNIKGLHVTVVEVAHRILQRVAAPETSQHINRLHQDHGTIILENTALDSLLGNANGQVEAVKLADGRLVDTDLVIVGIGINPAISLAEQAGLEINNGIKTNINCQTSDKSIFAVGDCASLPWKGTRVRLESVQNAIDQAECAASNAIGLIQDYEPTPWFWSDQYDARLQIAGLGNGYDNIIIRSGVAPSSSSYWYFKGEEFLAVDAINDARSYMVGKRMLELGKPLDARTIADANTNLNALLR